MLVKRYTSLSPELSHQVREIRICSRCGRKTNSNGVGIKKPLRASNDLDIYIVCHVLVAVLSDLFAQHSWKDNPTAIE